MLCPSGFSLALLLVAGVGNAVDASSSNTDNGQLGEIRQSILNVTSFTRLYGRGWVLMDGRDIKGTDLYREGLWNGVNIPDARGVFLRGRNYDRDPGTGNPAADLSVGSYQNDDITGHQHALVSDAGIFASVPMANAELKAGIEPNPIAFTDGQRDGITRLHSFATQPTGGSETRPRSIIVNTFIKVNRFVDVSSVF